MYKSGRKRVRRRRERSWSYKVQMQPHHHLHPATLCFWLFPPYRKLQPPPTTTPGDFWSI